MLHTRQLGHSPCPLPRVGLSQVSVLKVSSSRKPFLNPPKWLSEFQSFLLPSVKLSITCLSPLTDEQPLEGKGHILAPTVSQKAPSAQGEEPRRCSEVMSSINKQLTVTQRDFFPKVTTVVSLQDGPRESHLLGVSPLGSPVSSSTFPLNRADQLN